MNLYVTRHGESFSNIQNLVCGRKDVELTEEGHKQANLLAKKIQNYEIDQIITSPLKRAKWTAETISDYNDIPLFIDERLLEFDFGEFEGTKVDDEIFLNFRNQLAHKMPEGESILEAAQRIYNMLDEIKEENKTVLLVCHNGISRVINSYFHSLSDKEFFNFNINNCELICYSY